MDRFHDVTSVEKRQPCIVKKKTPPNTECAGFISCFLGVDFAIYQSHFGAHSREFPFSKVDFAVAAATYLEQVPPSVPEDPFHIVLAIIDFLPLICGNLFSLN